MLWSKYSPRSACELNTNDNRQSDTHPLIGARAPSTLDQPQCQRAQAAQPDPLASHLSDFLPQGDRLSRTDSPPSSTHWRSFRTGKPSLGPLHRCAAMTFALWIRFPSCCRLERFSLHRPDRLPSVTPNKLIYSSFLSIIYFKILSSFPHNQPSNWAKKSVFLTTTWVQLQSAAVPFVHFLHFCSFRPHGWFSTHRFLDVLTQPVIKSEEAGV